jgi:hypothetical protein
VPVSLSISHEDKRVIIVVEGETSMVEGMKALASLFAQGAFPYAKLIDLSYAPLTQGAKGLRQISQRVQLFARGRRPGPVAFVVRSELAREMIQIFDEQVGMKRPLGVFTDRESALAWLDEQTADVRAQASG